MAYNTNFPSINDLRTRAQAKVPRFAFEYLDGGCNDDVNLNKNTTDLRAIELKPYYLKPHQPANLKTELRPTMRLLGFRR